MIIKKLLLTHYRNFDFFESNFSPSITLIIGNNGVGKTNLLEAISLLTPGKGLRNADAEEICQNGEDDWHLASTATTKIGEAQLDILYSKSHPRKLVHFNGAKITNSELSNFMNIIWLTPQMENIFLGGPADRRKFLDRMVFASFSNHAQLVNKYEHHQRERMKILENNPYDSTWLDIVEKEMANLAIDIIGNRLKTIERINKNTKAMDSVFPKAVLKLESEIIELLNEARPEDLVIDRLKRNREQDRISNRTAFGAQKCDMRTYYASSNIPAEICSTGQQKALLISIIIAQQIEHAKSPILLLDEIFVHLDEQRRKALGDFLRNNKAQAFITSTEMEMQKYLGDSDVVELK